MNNEPVAWIKYIKTPTGSAYYCNTEGIGEPLYTHPHPDNLGLALSIIDQQKLEIERLKAKTLTDEEIISIYQSLWKFLPSEEPDLAKDIKKFARAILRKAQEK